MIMFFVTSGQMPDGYGFSAYGVTHLIWLGVIILVCILGSILIRKLDPKKQQILLTIVGIAVILQETSKNIIVSILEGFSVGYLPFHLCGINILLIGFDIIKPTKIVRNFLYFFCIPGAALALLFPNWTKMPFWNFFHFHSFIVHGLLVLYPVLLISSGLARPKIKDMPKCIGLLVLMAIPIYFLNLAWDTNFMFLMRPDSGNPLELFEKLLGSHLWGFPILLPVVMFIMYLPILIIEKIGKAKETKKEKETVKV